MIRAGPRLARMLTTARMGHDRNRISSRNKARARAKTLYLHRSPSPIPRRGPAPIMIHPGGKHSRRDG